MSVYNIIVYGAERVGKTSIFSRHGISAGNGIWTIRLHVNNTLVIFQCYERRFDDDTADVVDISPHGLVYVISVDMRDHGAERFVNWARMQYPGVPVSILLNKWDIADHPPRHFLELENWCRMHRIVCQRMSIHYSGDRLTAYQVICNMLRFPDTNSLIVTSKPVDIR